MTEDKKQAKFEEVKGEAKEAAGKVLGDKKLEVEGLIEKELGKEKESVEDLKNKL
ncbi:CsbD family protein [Streptococcus parauberis]|uniref:CsbD family protein n=1 Tax=Streptococcus parauberis TaxID=1348 RepID=UPI0037B7E1DE